jgi:hypothetical protein
MLLDPDNELLRKTFVPLAFATDVRRSVFEGTRHRFARFPVSLCARCQFALPPGSSSNCPSAQPAGFFVSGNIKEKHCLFYVQ